MKRLLGCASAASLVLFSMPALGEESARELLDKARDHIASAPALRRIDTMQDSHALIVGQERVEQQPQTSVVQIETDTTRHVARQAGAFQGKELIILKQGEKAAVKLGAG